MNSHQFLWTTNRTGQRDHWTGIYIYIYIVCGERFFTFIWLMATSGMQNTPQLNISKVATVIFGNLNLMVHLWWWLFIHAAGKTHIFKHQRSFLMFLHKNIVISNLWPALLYYYDSKQPPFLSPCLVCHGSHNSCWYLQFRRFQQSPAPKPGQC